MGAQENNPCWHLARGTPLGDDKGRKDQSPHPASASPWPPGAQWGGPLREAAGACNRRSGNHGEGLRTWGTALGTPRTPLCFSFALSSLFSPKQRPLAHAVTPGQMQKRCGRSLYLPHPRALALTPCCSLSPVTRTPLGVGGMLLTLSLAGTQGLLCSQGTQSSLSVEADFVPPPNHV